ncbi:LuxR C-terminal-related transcriptional regulator [Kocuria rosea]|uniref:LuxR C-terminal-related transcriptional regulator n=1 Tax=Kocuria rosea TaxID=1275 RepID=UPI00068A8FCF|nr:response regulator transcription factor [Kocuria polaris]
MRVLVYSPVRVFGDCMAAFLESAECVAAVVTEHDVLNLDLKAIELGADVVLIDATTPKAHSVPRLVKVVCPDVSAIAVAVSEVPEEVIACAESGFDAYVPRTARPAEMIEIIHRVQRGEMVCDPRITRTLFHELARRRAADPPSTPDGRLTPREIEIARLIGRGAANKEIAAELHLSVATIKNHVHSVLRKLQVDNRAQIAMLLLENPLALRRT